MSSNGPKHEPNFPNGWKADARCAALLRTYPVRALPRFVVASRGAPDFLTVVMDPHFEWSWNGIQMGETRHG